MTSSNSPSQTFSLQGHAAIITGASSGLGRHFALTLARAGAKVALAARRTDALAELAREIATFDGRAIPIKLDVTDEVSIKAAVADAETELGPISILINNSGIARVKPVLEHDVATWDEVVQTNLRGAWLIAQETARHMASHGKGGSIVNIASILALRTAGGLSSYLAAKAGLAHLSEGMAVELARHHIRVNVLAPGYYNTDINRSFFESAAGQAMIKRIPLRRLGEPRDLDGALLLLASDAGRYMTGCTIVVDGGHTITPI
ncbi:MAG: glucose 1-dehydrogenase [Alphaproteobacteria bacterium]|nr:glucose 1-dehydrogenase [Alphaproteobacteria bacterium]